MTGKCNLIARHVVMAVMGARLKGQVAIITGSSRGIGAAIAKRFSEEGGRVVVNYNGSKEKAAAVAEAISKAGGECILAKADVTQTSEVRRMVSDVSDKYGRIDILVNNAGVLLRTDFLESTDEDWDTVVGVNLKGAYICSREVARIMLTQQSGKMINISSVSGLAQRSALTRPDYASSKAGLLGLTRALAVRLAPHINVNAICPGTIETDMTSSIAPAAKDAMMRETLLERLGEPVDVANAAVFLASDESSWITGEFLTVGGGRGMR
jgi:3-oxoacyl-[acyl-carrier protein] reductase